MNSHITIQYEDPKTCYLRSKCGQIIKNNEKEIIIHTDSDYSVRFNPETNKGKRLDINSNTTDEIDINSYKLWDYNYEVHILLPAESFVSVSEKYSVIVRGVKSIDSKFVDEKLVLNFGFVNIEIQCVRDEGWVVKEMSNMSRNKTTFDCGFYENNKKDYSVFYLGSNSPIEHFEINSF